jgi:hypothetical protein
MKIEWPQGFRWWGILLWPVAIPLGLVFWALWYLFVSAPFKYTIPIISRSTGVTAQRRA